MGEETVLRPAGAGDQEAIRALLTAAGLPTEDLGQAPVEFVLAERQGEVVGVAGVEPLSPRMALLRSMAVKEQLRRGGLGGMLLSRIMEQAAARGMTDLFLLTISGAAFFAAHGFIPMARSDAPEPVRAHPQFTGLCPASALLMHLTEHP